MTGVSAGQRLRWWASELSQNRRSGGVREGRLATFPSGLVEFPRDSVTSWCGVRVTNGPTAPLVMGGFPHLARLTPADPLGGVLTNLPGPADRTLPFEDDFEFLAAVDLLTKRPEEVERPE